MAKIPVEIGDLSFEKKGDASEHYRGILYRHEIGAIISEPDATELYWLLERHPEATAKIGAGIDHFCIREAIFNTRCFEIARIDGTTTDFSFKSCVDGKAAPALSEALRALRAEAAEEMKQLKWEFFRQSKLPERKVRCALSGKELTLEEATLQHVPPNTFKSIALRFLKERKLDPARDFVTPSTDNQYLPKLTDTEVTKDWQKFYRETAIVRIIARRGSSA
jgi:hypothetical protein